MTVPFADLAPGLVDGLQRLADEYGPTGVVAAARQMWPATSAATVSDYRQVQDFERALYFMDEAGKLVGDGVAAWKELTEDRYRKGVYIEGLERRLVGLRADLSALAPGDDRP